MIRGFRGAAMMVVLSFLWVPWAQAADLSADYLRGRWVINESSCNSPKSEYLEFRPNGTFESTRTGKAEIVGFWEIVDGIVILHMVTSPAFFDDLHKDMRDHEGAYHYFQASLIIFNAQDRGFEGAGVIGSEVKRMSATRCS